MCNHRDMTSHSLLNVDRGVAESDDLPTEAISASEATRQHSSLALTLHTPFQLMQKSFKSHHFSPLSEKASQFTQISQLTPCAT